MASLQEQQMTAQITVFNRQRRVPVSLTRLKGSYERLCLELFSNLSDDAPKHLKKKKLNEIAQRGSFSVILVTSKRIRSLNRDWMGKDRPTDVLSFPLELEAPLSAEIPWQVGEIVISVEQAQLQADEFGHSLDRELAFLFVHGMLHVLGFDHMERAEEKDMFGRQKLILDKAGFKR
jgi:probable rRNA maturation factor